MVPVPGRQPFRLQPRPELLVGGGEPLVGVVQPVGAFGVAGKQALELGGEPASSVSHRAGHPPGPRGAGAGRRSGLVRRAGGWLRAAARRWVCRDASAGIKGLAVGARQTRRMPPYTPLWTLPTPPRERPRCCVTRPAFSAASTSSPPAWQTPQLPPSDPSAKHATLSRGSSQNWCMRSTPSVAPPSKRCAGVASTSPRDGVVRAARNRSREHHGGLHRQVNTPPNGRTAKITPRGASGPAERP